MKADMWHKVEWRVVSCRVPEPFLSTKNCCSILIPEKSFRHLHLQHERRRCRLQNFPKSQETKTVKATSKVERKKERENERIFKTVWVCVWTGSDRELWYKEACGRERERVKALALVVSWERDCLSALLYRERKREAHTATESGKEFGESVTSFRGIDWECMWM